MALQPDIAAVDYDKSVYLPPPDPSERLPERAARKLKELRRARDVAADLLKPANARADTAYADFRRAQDDLDRIKRAADSGQLVRNVEETFERKDGSTGRRVIKEFDTKRWEAEKAKVARRKVEFDDLRAERDRRAKIFDAVGGTCSDVENWLRELPRNARLRDFTGPEPKTSKGATPYDEWLKADTAVHHLKQRLAEIRSAPITAAEAKAEISSYVTDLAAVAMPDLSNVLAGAGIEAATWPKDRAQVFALTPAGTQISGHATVLDALALAAWTDPKRLIDRLCAEVDALDDGTGIAAEERKATLEKLEADLLAAERAREHWLVQMEMHGESGFRIRGASPLAVLGLEVIAK